MSQDKDDYTSLPDAFDRLDGVLEAWPGMKWADQLIKLSNFELELLQTRLAEVVDRRTRAELKLAVLVAGGEAEIAIARTDPEAARSLRRLYRRA